MLSFAAFAAPQAVVDAVVVLLESGAFEPSNNSCFAGVSLEGSSAAAEAAAEAAGAAPAAETAALQFLAAHLAANRAVVSGGMLLRVLQHLAATGAPAADMPPAEREAVFCDVVAAAGSSMGPADLQQARELRQQGRRLLLPPGPLRRLAAGSAVAPRNTVVQACPPVLQAIFLAMRVGFLQAEARVRHAEGVQAEALACLARDSRCAGGISCTAGNLLFCCVAQQFFLRLSRLQGSRQPISALISANLQASGGRLQVCPGCAG